ncbi:C-type lectin domain family 4 member E-like [Clupea harengus]|uniref:C-type lectin domain family 4 member E-like n=1 Tax=Clupea harengus TaxID=7950 RepID=A0A6P8EVG9_CLUHA|nr:C-type lectin domain family 4 member E-like [Clupea harengus]XP_031416199.1 C-type lectin domain family 4 member E-like [Clupea harengus]
MAFGLLCVLQVALNVYLRINCMEDNIQHNVTGHKQLLQTNDSILEKEIELLKASNNILTKERDQLLRAKGNSCPEKWMSFGSSCYYKSSIKATWSDSRQDCRERGADLIIINTKEEQDFVRNLHTRAWIGLDWKWVDETPLINGFWKYGEPNENNDAENCVEVDGHASNSEWNDIPCDFLWYWICEKPINPELLKHQA